MSGLSLQLCRALRLGLCVQFYRAAEHAIVYVTEQQSMRTTYRRLISSYDISYAIVDPFEHHLRQVLDTIEAEQSSNEQSAIVGQSANHRTAVHERI